MKHIAKSCYILPALLCAAGAVQAEGTWGDDLAKMVSDGKASLDLRYRYEHVDQDNFNSSGNDKHAKASTLRSRVTLASAPLNGVSVLLELDDLSEFGGDDYNSTTNGNTQYPVIADPEGTDINQAWIKYAGENYDGTYGRQRILNGDQRFIGGVAWRQNEQTYDGFRANWAPVEDLKLDVSYVYNVSRIFGPDDGVNPADLKGDNYFIRGDYQANDNHKIAGYSYLLDFDEQSAYIDEPGKTVNNSSDTYGIEYRGKFDKISLAAAYATQGEAGGSTLDYNAKYYLLELGANLDVVNLKVGYEVLGADDGVGFKTPLATGHKFQGWADKFLGTPPDGVEDAYVGVSGKAGPVKLAAIYHDFQAEDSSEDFGTELDLVATWPVNKQFSVQAKYAGFDSDSDRLNNKDKLVFDDTDKIWVTLQLKL